MVEYQSVEELAVDVRRKSFKKEPASMCAAAPAANSSSEGRQETPSESDVTGVG
jgi:hypothetical protein